MYVLKIFQSTHNFINLRVFNEKQHVYLISNNFVIIEYFTFLDIKETT